MHRPPRPVIALLLLGLLAGLYAGYQWWTTRGLEPNRLTAAGTLEGEQVVVAAELTARVVRVLVERGSLVEAGQPLLQLDDSELQRRYRQAPAGGPEQQLLQLQLDKTIVRAPGRGLIAERAVEPGEIAVLGAPLLIIERAEAISLILFVSERQIGRVGYGQTVRLTTDSLAGQTFTGVIDYISPRAEFTPRNVQTPKDRSLLVFAVRARVPNLDGRLKPGMPVDAEIVE
jgi:HlyD family secretion protein